MQWRKHSCRRMTTTTSTTCSAPRGPSPSNMPSLTISAFDVPRRRAQRGPGFARGRVLLCPVALARRAAGFDPFSRRASSSQSERAMRLAVLYPDPARGRGKKDASKKGGHVSFALKSGLLPQSVACPLRARTRHRTCASKGKTPPTRHPKEKAPAGGWGFHLREATQQYTHMPPRFQRFRRSSRLPRCGASCGWSARLDIDCLGGLYGLRGLLDREMQYALVEMSVNRPVFRLEWQGNRSVE